MAIVGKDRRGLGEIVTLASILCVIGGVVITELLITHTASTELIVVLAGVGAAQGARGVQSAMERSASTEQRNHESSELRHVTELLRREAEEMRRANEINRVVMLTAAAQPKKGE